MWTKDIDLTHQGQFLTPDSQIRTNSSLTHDKKRKTQSKKALNHDFVSFLCSNEIKARVSSFGSAQTSSKYVRTFSATFGSLRKVVGKSSKVAGTFPEISVMR